MIIFLLALSMMFAMAVAAIILLLEEAHTGHRNMRSTPFNIASLRKLRSN